MGPTTLKRLKHFFLAPPFWVNTFEPIDNPAHTSPSRLEWSGTGEGYGKLKKTLREFHEDTGPGQLYKVVQAIQPEIFFTSTQAQFHSKELLPCWARIRCIHVFHLVMMTNDNDTRDLDFPRSAEIFFSQKEPYPEHWKTPPEYLAEQGNEAAKYLRGAIQLRPALQRLSDSMDRRQLTGDDITTYANSEEVFDDPLEWTEDWNYSRSCSEAIVYSGYFQEADKNHQKQNNDLSPIYKEWLRDPQLADQVAQAFNEGVKEHGKVAYPFCHSDYPGKVYFETSLCQSRDGKVWLDRPRHKGCYSHINIEKGTLFNFIGKMFKEPRSYTPLDKVTLHPHLDMLPLYRPSI